jgi:hypothetical protein
LGMTFGVWGIDHRDRRGEWGACARIQGTAHMQEGIASMGTVPRNPGHAESEDPWIRCGFGQSRHASRRGGQISPIEDFGGDCPSLDSCEDAFTEPFHPTPSPPWQRRHLSRSFSSRCSLISPLARPIGGHRGHMHAEAFSVPQTVVLRRGT